MPRGKESEDESEPRGRRTRAAALSVTDSPLRRSTRNRQTPKDDPQGDNSSPESVTSDAGPPTRTRRRMTPTQESVPSEPVRTLRPRKTSTTSDVSEAAESENGGEGRKRSTRRSSVVPSAIETPTKARLRRATRAGSESKTMSPVVRVTRRTRASSVDPEPTENHPPTTPSTPLRNRRQRASVLPSEPPLFEEVNLPKAPDNEDDDVFVDDEVVPPATPSRTTPPPTEKSPNTDGETREALEASLEALITNNATPQPPTPQKLAETRQKLMDTANENAAKDLPKVLVEKTQVTKQETSPGNKENEKNPKIPSERTLKLFKSTTKPKERKSFNTTVLERVDVDSRLNISVDEKLLKSRTPLKVVNLEGEPEEKEGSIIFIDDTDTDDTGIDALNKSTDVNQNDDDIIITPIANDDLSPCKSQFVKNLGPDDDDDEEEKVEENKEVDMETDSGEGNLKSLFKDIPADNWQNGTDSPANNNEESLVNVEDDDKDSDGEFDLVLVGKGGWSGDENEEEKKKENFNYDSDDTVIVQKEKKSLETSVVQEEPMEVDEVEETDVDAGEMNLSQRKSLNSSRKSLNSSRKSKTPVKEKKTDDDDDGIVPDVEDQLNKSRDMIYAFESGIPVGESISDEKTSDVEEILNRSGKRLSSESRKSVGKNGVEENSQVDKSRKSISEARKSLGKSKTPVKEGNSEDSVEENSIKKRKSLSGRSSLNESKSPVNNRQLKFSSSDNEDEGEDEAAEIEDVEKSRKSVSRKSVDGSKTPVKEKKDVSGVDEEMSSPKDLENVNKSRKSVTSSELRVSLGKSKTPVKEKESSASEKEETNDKSDKATPRKSIDAKTPVKTPAKTPVKTSVKTPAKPQQNEESSSEDEDPEAISRKFNKTKSPEIKSSGIYDKLKSLSKGEESSSSEEEMPEDDEEETLEVEETLNKSKKSPRKSLSQSKTPVKTPSKQSKESSPQKEDKEVKKSERMSSQKRKSLVKQQSSEEEEEDDNEEKSEDNEDEEDNEDDEEKQESPKKVRRSLSTIVQLNSSPDADELSDSDVEKSMMVPQFLYTVENDSSSSDMDSDIQREYNLDGASNEEYSDDDVPGDDCLVSGSEESDEDEDEDDDDMGDFLNDEDSEEDEDEEDEDEEDQEQEDSDDTLESEEETEQVPSISPSKIEGKSRKSLEKKSGDSSTPKLSIEDRKSESAKKSKTPKLSTPLRIVELPASKSESAKKSKTSESTPLRIVELAAAKSESAKKNKTPKSTPSRIIDLPVAKSVEKSQQTPNSTSQPKKPKSAKKFEMNHTLVLEDPELVDTRLLMKEKLNDSLPILKTKRLSSRKSELGVLSEDKSESKVDEDKESKKKTKSSKRKTSESEILEEISQNVEGEKSKKKSDESLKRKKSDADLSAKTKKNKIQLVKLASDSDSDEPEVLSFDKARDQALVAMKKEQESIKAIKEGKKRAISAQKSVKRLPEEILENLADVPLRPKKKRKINNDIFMPSRSMFDREDKKPKGLRVDDEFVPISLSGGTTSFEVVSLKKSKDSKKNSSQSFKERMMNRATRQPMSAYMVYQQKLKASGKNKF